MDPRACKDGSGQHFFTLGADRCSCCGKDRTAIEGPRYYVKSRPYCGIGRKSSTPHVVVDRQTSQEIDEYASKRAAVMHAKELNKNS